MKLYFAANTRAIRIAWLFEELEMDYEIGPFTLGDKSMREPDYLAVNPNGRVPTIVDGDVTIHESGAIVEYILARYTDGALKPAVDSPLFPQYLQWFHYCEGMVMPPINTIVVQTILLPPERQNKEALDQATRLLSRSLAPVNETLAGKDYLIGDFSAADVMLGHACFMSNRFGCIGDELTDLLAYVKRIEARPAFQKAMNT